MPRPPSTAVDDGGEVVVGEDHVAGFLGHLGAGDAHRDADVGALQRRSVVDPVAGHRDDVALALQHVDEAHLVLGRDAGDDADAVHLLARAASSLSAANSVPVSARPSMPSWFAIAAAVVAWSPVIMRTRIPASLHSAIASLASLRGGSTMPTAPATSGPRTSSSSVAAGSNAPGSMSRVATASTRRPSPASRSFSARTRLAAALGGNGRAVGVADLRRPREQDVGRALDEAADDLPAAVLHLVERRHELVVGVERHLGDARVDAPRLVDVDSALGGQDDQGCLGRVADDLAVADGGVVGERHRQQERLERGVRLAGDAQDLARRWSSPRPRS